LGSGPSRTSPSPGSGGGGSRIMRRPNNE
jgi:hypothetical protein